MRCRVRRQLKKKLTTFNPLLYASWTDAGHTVILYYYVLYIYKFVKIFLSAVGNNITGTHAQPIVRSRYKIL